MEIEKFELLEEKLNGVVKLYKRMREENTSMKSELEKREREIRMLKEQLKGLMDAKKEAFAKVRNIIEELDSLGL